MKPTTESGTLCKIRTYDLPLRRRLLLSSELIAYICGEAYWTRTSDSGVAVRRLSNLAKASFNKALNISSEVTVLIIFELLLFEPLIELTK